VLLIVNRIRRFELCVAGVAAQHGGRGRVKGRGWVMGRGMGGFVKNQLA
jgi:hypothetical protein